MCWSIKLPMSLFLYSIINLLYAIYIIYIHIIYILYICIYIYIINSLWQMIWRSCMGLMDILRSYRKADQGGDRSTLGEICINVKQGDYCKHCCVYDKPIAKKRYQRKRRDISSTHSIMVSTSGYFGTCTYVFDFTHAIKYMQCWAENVSAAVWLCGLFWWTLCGSCTKQYIYNCNIRMSVPLSFCMCCSLDMRVQFWT